jgi:hypothetical protein
VTSARLVVVAIPAPQRRTATTASASIGRLDSGEKQTVKLEIDLGAKADIDATYLELDGETPRLKLNATAFFFDAAGRGWKRDWNHQLKRMSSPEQKYLMAQIRYLEDQGA